MLEKTEQWPLTVVESDEVDEVEDAGLTQVTQLGVHVAAAQHDLYLRKLPANEPGHAKRPVNIAGKRYGKTDDLRTMSLHQLARHLVEQPVHQRGRGLERVDDG